MPASVAQNVVRVELYVNSVKYGEARGRSVVIPVLIGDYIRRLRVRVAGYDAQNNVVGEDEMVVNPTAVGRPFCESDCAMRTADG